MAVCELSAVTVGSGRKVLGVTPRSGDGCDMGGSLELEHCKCTASKWTM